jgi:hypothetical protein
VGRERRLRARVPLRRRRTGRSAAAASSTPSVTAGPAVFNSCLEGAGIAMATGGGGAESRYPRAVLDARLDTLAS